MPGNTSCIDNDLGNTGAVSLRRGKPLLTADQQIAHLKARGVTFALCSEADAYSYLTNENNYLRTASYRKLYSRQLEGNHVGDYINLDFGNLVALSSLDRKLREVFLTASIDVEHFARMKILKLIEERGEDGYGILEDFLASSNHSNRNAIQGDMSRRSRNDKGRDIYVGDLIAHYSGGMPTWVFLEVVEFGTFLTFYKYCAKRWEDGVMLQEHYVLRSVKALRNATAHNHCIINGFSQGAEPSSYTTPLIIMDSLNAAGMGRTKTRRAKLANLRIAQMAATLYSLNVFCVHGSTLARNAERLAALRIAYVDQLPHYRKNNVIVSSFDFLWKLVDIWVPVRTE